MPGIKKLLHVLGTKDILFLQINRDIKTLKQMVNSYLNFISHWLQI